MSVLGILKEDKRGVNVQDVLEGTHEDVLSDGGYVLGEGKGFELRIMREGAVSDRGDLPAFQVGRNHDRTLGETSAPQTGDPDISAVKDLVSEVRCGGNRDLDDVLSITLIPDRRTRMQVDRARATCSKDIRVDHVAVVVDVDIICHRLEGAFADAHDAVGEHHFGQFGRGEATRAFVSFGIDKLDRIGEEERGDIGEITRRIDVDTYDLLAFDVFGDQEFVLLGRT